MEMMNMAAAVRDTRAASGVSATGISAQSVFVLFAIFTALYFPMMATLPLSIDAELTTLSPDHFYWIAQGRWGAYIVTQLFPPHLVPYFTMAIFGVCASVGYVMLLDACKMRLDWRAGVGFAVFCGFPIWSLILEFSSNTVQAGLALLCCCVALWLLVRRMGGGSRRALSIIAEIALITFAVALYQAFVFVYAALVLASLLLAPRPLDKGVRTILNACGVLAVAIVLYYVIGKAFSSFLKVTPQYVGQFMRLDVVFGDPVGTLSRTGLMALDAYAGGRTLFGQPLYAAAVVSILFAVAVVLRANAWHALLAVCMIATPFVLLFAAGGREFPPRALLGIPVAMWVMSMVAMQATARLLRAAGVLAVAIVAFQSAAAVGAYQTVRDLRSEFDRRIASEIHQEIAKLADGSPQKVDFYGGVKAFEPVLAVGLHSTAAGSFFSWDGGAPLRIFGYMHMMGYQDIVQVGSAERQALRPEYEAMPIWPKPGSVRKFQDVVLVKLSDAAGVYY